MLKHDIKFVFKGHIKCEMVVNIAITQNTKSFFHFCWCIALLMKNNRKPLYNGDHWPKGEFVHSTEFLQHLPSDAHNDTPTYVHYTHTTHTFKYLLRGGTAPSTPLDPLPRLPPGL